MDSYLKVLSLTSSRRYVSEENLIVVTRKGLFESKPSLVITYNQWHENKQNKHWRFLSRSFKALAFFSDVKHKELRTEKHSITAPDVIVLLHKSPPYTLFSERLNLLQFYTQKLSVINKRETGVIATF